MKTKISIIAVISLLVTGCSAHSYDHRLSEIVVYSLELNDDSFQFAEKGCIPSEIIQGKLITSGDTIVLNPNITKEELELISIHHVPSKKNDYAIKIVNLKGADLPPLEGWSNDSIEYCCMIDFEGQGSFRELPNYDSIWVNPIAARNYVLMLPIRKKLLRDHITVYTISEPTEYFLPFESEVWLLRDGRNLILLDEDRSVTNVKFDKTWR